MRFLVKLGFTEITVEAESLSEARDKAWKVLCEFWPNHIDMITAKREQIQVQCEKKTSP